MRTDVKIQAEFNEVRVPQIPLCSGGRPSYVTRGDFIEWGAGFRGRIVGLVKEAGDLDVKENHLVTVMIMLSGCCCERWVKASEVTNSARGRKSLQGGAMVKKGAWFYSDGFLNTPVDSARDCIHIVDLPIN